MNQTTNSTLPIIPPAVAQRIDDFCRELALELRRITGREAQANALDLPQAVTRHEENSHEQ